jgi:hypothetical protein
MTRADKLVKRFISEPSDFKFHELVKLLAYFKFYQVNTGKTSGSRVRFGNKEGISIILHKPHQDGVLKKYQLRQVKEILCL